MMDKEEQQKSLNEFMASSLETSRTLKKKHKKRFFLLVLIVLLGIFFLFYGPFSFMFIAKKELRLYDVRVNDQKVTVREKIANTTIIPVLFEIQNGDSYVYFENIEDNSDITNDTYSFAVQSYTCYRNGDEHQYPISCDQNSQFKYLNTDTTYYKMQILKFDYEDKYTYSISNDYLSRSYYRGENSIVSSPYKEYTVIYEGKVNNDFTSYIGDEGVYLLEIYFKYSGTKGSILFGVVNDGEKVFVL